MRFSIERKHAEVFLDTEAGTISGNTYPMKDWLKKYFDGMKWDKEEKVWRVDCDVMTKVINRYRRTDFAGYISEVE